MVREIVTSLLLSGIAHNVVALGDNIVASPDGNLIVSVNDADEIPCYSVKYNDDCFIRQSRIGFKTDLGDYSTGLKLTAISPIEPVNEQYSIPNIKKSNVDYRANRRIFSFSKDSIHVFDIVFQVSDNDVAFKYILLPQKDALTTRIEKEMTEFVLPDGTTSFLCPQSHPMGGFARTSPSYETPYTCDEPIGKNGWGEGYTFPCLFKNNDNGWILLSETGVDGTYCGGRLVCESDSAYTIGFPQKGEMNGLGSEFVGLPLPGETPWRTITIGRDLAPIAETTIAFDVVKPQYAPSRDYEYGKGSWSWIMGMDESVNFDEQIRYIDFSSAMGFNSILVDSNWDAQIGRDKIEELARYGKSKGVDLYLWYNSNGFWNDTPQTPRHIMNNPAARRQEMQWMNDNGIRGIKVDFFGSDKQEMMKLYQDILTDANDYGLMVIFHGCTLPRGWERMFPNYASSEAVLASENLHFFQDNCDKEAYNATIFPFVRNTLGSMDFGGSALNQYYNRENKPYGTKRKTSDVFALATAVLFQSPVQHFALAPNNLEDAPSWAIDFMKDVPTTWDDIRLIDGYPGRYVVLGRKHNDQWYIAGVNAEDGKKSISIDLSKLLPELPKDERISCTVIKDESFGKDNVKNISLKPDSKYKIEIPCNGGFVMKISMQHK